jgi:hypothetical protein
MRGKIVVIGIAIVAMAFSVAAGDANAVTIDLWNSFPDSQGERNFYAYGYSYNGYRSLTDVGSYAFATPEQYLKWSLPALEKLTNQWIHMHPTAYYQCAYYFPPEDAVLAWSVPTSGEVDLSGTFWDEGNGGGISVFVKKNTSTLWSSYVNYTQQSSFSLSDIQVNAGDKIYFHVNAGGGGDISDWGRLKGQIDYSPVPEPASFVLFGMGGLVAALIRRKGRKI